MSGPVTCNKEDCPKEWERDPVLEVACPACDAGVGEKYKRPSGHGGPFVHPHAARDYKADREGHYGECPKGRCGSGNPDYTEPRESAQQTLEDLGVET